MSTQNKAQFAKTYAAEFVKAYPHLPAEQSAKLIEKAVTTACGNIRTVNIDSPAFKATCKTLGIKCTYKAIEEFFGKEA